MYCLWSVRGRSFSFIQSAAKFSYEFENKGVKKMKNWGYETLFLYLEILSGLGNPAERERQEIRKDSTKTLI